MPELPEVETIVRTLREQAGGAVIESGKLFSPHLKTPGLPAKLKGARIEDVTRRAKYIICELSNGYGWMTHLRMTGKFQFAEPGAARDKHTHLRVKLADGRLLEYHDVRKFGRMWVAQLDQLHAGPQLAVLGPEPLSRDFTADALRSRVAGRKRAIKETLLDQSIVAGFGNIYVVEALFDAGIDPRLPAGELTDSQARALVKAGKAVLKRAIKWGGTTLRDYAALGEAGKFSQRLKAYGREGEPCPRCGAEIERFAQGQRSSWWCPSCQG